jgi:glucose/arabinose dehydrogenase
VARRTGTVAVTLAVAAALIVTAAATEAAGDVPATTRGDIAAAASAVAAAAPVSSLRVTTSQVRGGFSAPTQVTSGPDGRSRLFVVEQRGVVKAVTAHTAKTYLDIRSRVRSSGEQGMLGLAFSPRFRSDHRLYVTYTRSDGALVLARLTAKRPKAKRVRAKTLRTLLVVKHPTYSNHNGGSIAFGPDGYLYLGTGDGGGGGNPFHTAGNLDSLRGKILRLDVSHACGKRRYCIPSTNPYRGKKPGKAQILHRGVRNPWRFSFDPSGRLWIADVGQDKYEEVDVLPRGARGLDLGWSCREGKHAYDASQCRRGASYVEPVIELGHSDVASSPGMAAESITGGYVYRGSAYAALAAGAYVFGDWVTGNLWAYRDGVLARVGSLPQVTSFGEDDHGELYAVTSAGSLVRLRFSSAG